jgi:hypothetical protein
MFAVQGKARGGFERVCKRMLCFSGLGLLERCGHKRIASRSSPFLSFFSIFALGCLCALGQDWVQSLAVVLRWLSEHNS